MQKVSIVRSETWLTDNLTDIGAVLDEAIKDFCQDAEIINIQVVTDKSGLSRFWIYLKEK